MLLSRGNVSGLLTFVVVCVATLSRDVALRTTGGWIGFLTDRVIAIAIVLGVWEFASPINVDTFQNDRVTVHPLCGELWTPNNRNVSADVTVFFGRRVGIMSWCCKYADDVHRMNAVSV